MILVDTSVWIDHFRRGSKRLSACLNDGAVLCHPYVVGELACGNLNNREEILSLLGTLPEARIAEPLEVMHLVDSYHLHGRGLDWIDMHLLSSARLTDCGLWTRDKRLKSAAARLRIPV